MVNRNDVHQSLTTLADGHNDVDKVMKVVDGYAKQRTTAQEIAQTIQIIAFFTLLGWIAWLVVAR